MKTIVRGKFKKHGGGVKGTIHVRVIIRCQSPEQSLLPEMDNLAVNSIIRSYNYQS
jgi:hypothetical protein